MALLAAETLHFGDREARDPLFGEGLAHVVELEGFDDGGDLLHCGVLPAVSLNLLVIG
ncbi:hypothetical protein D3C84_1280490 [compost metagenome]